ncbi:MAG: hypothetical protein GY851_23875, partial [bacterium]|nr:hypothetical protein [bacterium]
KVRALHDPDGVIEALQRAVPTYPSARAAHRVQAAVRAARFSLYVLRWLDKAAGRGDVFSFLKHEYELLDYLFTALYALNQEWLCEEKRLVERVTAFDRVPHDIDIRLSAVIVHKGPCASLDRSLKELKSLFADLSELALDVRPDLDVPVDWD